MLEVVFLDVMFSFDHLMICWVFQWAFGSIYILVGVLFTAAHTFRIDLVPLEASHGYALMKLRKKWVFRPIFHGCQKGIDPPPLGGSIPSCFGWFLGSLPERDRSPLPGGSIPLFRLSPSHFLVTGITFSIQLEFARRLLHWNLDSRGYLLI